MSGHERHDGLEGVANQQLRTSGIHTAWPHRSPTMTASATTTRAYEINDPPNGGRPAARLDLRPLNRDRHDLGELIGGEGMVGTLMSAITIGARSSSLKAARILKL